jgi:hypothetical protein
MPPLWESGPRRWWTPVLEFVVAAGAALGFVGALIVW